MSKNSIIQNYMASGEEVYQTVSSLEQALEGASRPVAVIALIAMALQIQFPNLSPEDRVEGVKDVTRYVCLWLDSKMEQEGDKVVVN